MKSAVLQYANALADIALTQGAFQPASKQLADFGTVYSESTELRTFLSSPAVTREEKHAVLEKISGRLGVTKIIRNFLFVVSDHRRMHILPEIIAAFDVVVRQRQGIAEAAVTSAVELTPTEKTQLTATLTRLTGKTVEPKFSLDPTLLGGAVVRIGDTVYDGSLRSRLNDIREHLAAE